jgi:hypothetical protein
MENGLLCGMTLGAQRGRVIPVNVRNAVLCVFALPGEARKSIVDGTTLREAQPHPEFAEKLPTHKLSPQPSPDRPEAPRGRGADLTLSDVVRNQAVYLTRMQESLGSMERGMLKMQSEVTRLSREMSAIIAERAVSRPKASPQFSILSVKADNDAAIELPEQPQEPDCPESIRDERFESAAEEPEPEDTVAAEPEAPAEQPEESSVAKAEAPAEPAEINIEIVPEEPAEPPEVDETVEPVEPTEVDVAAEPEEPAEPPEADETVEPEEPAEPPEDEDEPDLYFPVT